jgi:hypothetical protein
MLFLKRELDGKYQNFTPKYIDSYDFNDAGSMLNYSECGLKEVATQYI